MILLFRKHSFTYHLKTVISDYTKNRNTNDEELCKVMDEEHPSFSIILKMKYITIKGETLRIFTQSSIIRKTTKYFNPDENNF